ncbi:MAG: hypothetical protein ACXACC_02305 [Promethearchaeota archaeon]|jgi:hypothetical protein
MIFQGLFNILSLYLDDIDLFYDAIDKYFRERINDTFPLSSINQDELTNTIDELVAFIKDELLKMGFTQDEIKRYKILDFLIVLNKHDKDRISSIPQFYDSRISPIIFEIFLEKFVDYLVDLPISPLILNLKSKGFLPLEFIIEMRNLKDLFDANPEKKENLKKYIQIKENFIKKLSKNKVKIESLEDLNVPKDKLQLIYLIYRIVSFFHLEKIFDFSHIKEYIVNNVKEWLTTIPLVTLKNPDLYFCGLFLAKNLNIELSPERVKKFLLDLYEEGIDEFEAPLVEATDGLYYFLKSTEFMKIWLNDEKVNRLIDTDPKFFESNYLKNLETSQLVVILKIYTLLKRTKLVQNINAILEELEQRITPEGIKQYRDGFLSSEATYYVLFCNYMRNSLDKLKEHDILKSIVSRIYRNLELLEFSADMNFDLISELFYSFESLKLINCIETRQMIIHLAKYLFPKEVVEKMSLDPEIIKPKARFRHLKVDKMTGETIY